MSELHTFGPHSARVEADLTIVHFVGPLHLREARPLFALWEQIIAVQGHVYVVAHLEKANTVDADVRREFVEWMKTNPLLAMANVKASLLSRGLGILMGNALRLLGIITFVSGYFETEAEARHWLAQLEQKRMSQRKSQP